MPYTHSSIDEIDYLLLRTFSPDTDLPAEPD